MTAIYESRDLAAAVAEKLKVYAQPQRLMILSCLLRGERNVAEIGEVTGIGQPALSQQLAELRRAELVSTRKEAKQVWYVLANASVGICVQSREPTAATRDQQGCARNRRVCKNPLKLGFPENWSVA
jgi:DNA-binding transcriptional ArsR family regulator